MNKLIMMDTTLQFLSTVSPKSLEKYDVVEQKERYFIISIVA